MKQTINLEYIKKIQIKEGYCGECREGNWAGQAFTGYKCKSCGNEYQHHNTNTPKYCLECSIKLRKCRWCEKTLNLIIKPTKTN